MDVAIEDLDPPQLLENQGMNVGDQNMVHAEENVQNGWPEWPVNEEENAQNGWPQWPDDQAEQVANNNPFPQHPDQPQDSISFDQSDSSATYLRATGPDLVLRVEDICNIACSDSSFESSVDSVSEAHRTPSITFQLLEARAFRHLTPPPPIIPRPINIEQGLSGMDIPVNSAEDNNLALVPWCPCPATILLRFWAEEVVDFRARSLMGRCSPMVNNELDDFHDEALGVGVVREGNLSLDVPSSHNTPLKTVLSLPSTVSISNPLVPLEESSVRRSARLSRNKEGFQLFQLEDHPRKKQWVWAEVPITRKVAVQLLNDPPQPSQDEVIGQIPVEVMQAWGIECNVAPEEITEEALSKGISN
jgi:hypothetical protein